MRCQRKRSYPEDEDPEHVARCKVDKMIKEAEASKARMVNMPCNEPFNLLLNSQKQCSSSVDENYIVVRAHVDSGLRDKIRYGEYVDFA